MPIKFGSSAIGKLCLGSSEVSKVYLGSSVLYENTPTPSYEYTQSGSSLVLTNAPYTQSGSIITII